MNANPKAICAHCGNYFEKHIEGLGKFYCNDRTNGDTWSDAPDEEAIGYILQKNNRALYDLYVVQWKRENGHAETDPPTETDSNHNPDIGPDGWDKEAVYDNEISPLMAQIIAICKREKMPLLFSVVYRQSDDTGDGDTARCTTHLPGPNEKFNDRFEECRRILYRVDFPVLAFTINKAL